MYFSNNIQYIAILFSQLGDRFTNHVYIFLYFPNNTR